ncbi:hypothetical protein QL285_044604 [Trifolium repens]|nr:hypothetical protein QL285_044604 [Trifolium repens]
MAPRKKQGKRNDQVSPKLESSKRPKGATASVRREKQGSCKRLRVLLDNNGSRPANRLRRKRNDVKGPLWSNYAFGDVVLVKFPGGPKEQDVLSSYESRIVGYVYKGFVRVQLTPISHGRKLRVFNKKLPNEAWFLDKIAKTGLADLATTGHMLVDPYMAHVPADTFPTLLSHIADYEVKGNQDEVLRHQNFTIMTSLLLLVGYTIFADTSKNCVHMHHMNNFDDLETVSEIAWGSTALVCLYKGLSTCTAPSVSTLTGYMTLLLAWIHHHFPTLCERLKNQSYVETMPAANKYCPRGGEKSVSATRVSLDRLLGCDIHWAP